MGTLSIRVAGSEQDAPLSTIPYRVLDSFGDPVMEGFASTIASELSFELNDQAKRDLIHVVATLPTGKQVSAPVTLSEGRGELVLLEGQVPDKSLEWLKPFRSLDHIANALHTESKDHPLRDVWMTLWCFSQGSWKAVQPKFSNLVKDDDVQQISVSVPNELRLLQIGGSKLAWRLLVLPPGGEVRVALTRREVPTDEAVDITVARSRPTHELLMSYLSRGSFDLAEKLGNEWKIADEALYHKNEDPVSAAAGAYVLYRLNRLEGREHWVENLASRFPYMADGSILQAAMLLKQRNPNKALARSLIDRSLERGFPVFRIGLSILVETMAALHRGAKGELGEVPERAETKRFRESFLGAQAYLGAQVQSGVYFSFYGRSPVQPSWAKEYGRPESKSNALPCRDLPKTVAYGKVRVFLGGATTDRAAHVDADSARPGRLRARDLQSTKALERTRRLLEASTPDAIDSFVGRKSPAGEALGAPGASLRRTQTYWRGQRLDSAIDLASDGDM